MQPSGLPPQHPSHAGASIAQDPTIAPGGGPGPLAGLPRSAAGPHAAAAATDAVLGRGKDHSHSGGYTQPAGSSTPLGGDGGGGGGTTRLLASHTMAGLPTRLGETTGGLKRGLGGGGLRGGGPDVSMASMFGGVALDLGGLDAKETGGEIRKQSRTAKYPPNPNAINPCRIPLCMKPTLKSLTIHPFSCASVPTLSTKPTLKL